MMRTSTRSNAARGTSVFFELYRPSPLGSWQLTCRLGNRFCYFKIFLFICHSCKLLLKFFNLLLRPGEFGGLVQIIFSLLKDQRGLLEYSPGLVYIYFSLPYNNLIMYRIFLPTIFQEVTRLMFTWKDSCEKSRSCSLTMFRKG